MKCMCPNCGNIIDNGHLSFDFTEYVRILLKKQMRTVDNDDIEEGRDILLNAWREKDPILLSESTLWAYPLSNKYNDNNREKWVDFSVPVDLLLKKQRHFDAFNKNDVDEKVKAFTEWLEIHKDEASKQVYPIRLVATGDGDIKFDRIPGVAEVRKCPFCYSEMSYWAGRYQEWTLTVLGGPRVSKTTAVTSCVAAFMRGRDSLVSFEGSDKDKGYNLFKRECLDKYEDGLDLGATDINADNIPRVSFRVTVGNRNKNICLTFVDVPGEFNNEKGIDARLDERYRKIFNSIDFVWYCTDPGEVQQLQSSEIVKYNLGYVDKEVMATNRIKDNMRTLATYFSHSKRKVPVAYIMGKTDSEAISEDDKRQYGLYNSSQPEVVLPFNVKSFFRRSEKVKKYINSKNNDGLVREFERMFPARCYIATSAYGYNPKNVSANSRPERKSYNCKEAFYWMLAIRNCVDVCVENTTTCFLGFGARTEEVEGKLTELPDELREKTYRNLYMEGNYVS